MKKATSSNKAINNIDFTIQIIFRRALKEKSENDKYTACVDLASQLVKFRNMLADELEVND